MKHPGCLCLLTLTTTWMAMSDNAHAQNSLDKPARVAPDTMSDNAHPQNISLDTTARVVAEIRRTILADCIFVVTDFTEGLQISVTATSISRALSQKQIQATVIRTTSMHMTRKMTTSCKSPLFALFSLTTSLRQQLALLADERLMSGATWLLFSTQSEPLDALMAGVHVPFDCVFVVVRPVSAGVRLTEVYHVTRGSPLQEATYSEWGPRQIPRPLTLYKRRNNLLGIQLRATGQHDPPISIFETVNNRTELGGFSGDVWKIFERRMNFSTVHSVAVEGAQGNASTWGGTVGAILRGDADVTASVVTMTPETSAVVDFMFPLYTIYSRVFIRKPDGRKVYWDSFLTPFSTPLWVAFVVSTLATALLLAMLYHVMRTYDPEEEQYSLSDAILYVFGAIFCQQGHERMPRTAPPRIVHLFVYVTSVIAINSYSGSIISTLTVSRPSLPFSNLRGLHEDNTYRLGVLNNSFVFDMFKNAHQPYLKDLFAKHVVADPLRSNREGFERVCASLFAFVSTDKAEAVLRDNLKCPVISLPEHFVKFSASIAFPRHSPYRGLFNHNVLKLLNSGVVSNLYASAVAARPTTDIVELQSIDMRDVTPIMAIMVGGFLAAAAFFVSEHVVRRLINVKHPMSE